MKRFIIIAILALCTLSASAQSVKGLIEQYRHEKNVIHLHITPALMSFLKVLAKSHSDDSKALKAVSSFRILVFDDYDSIVKSRFRNTVQTFHPKGYTPIIYNKQADETNYVYLKEKKGCIREVLILAIDKEDGAIVRIKGKISPNDVDSVVKESTNKKNLKSYKL